MRHPFKNKIILKTSENTACAAWIYETAYGQRTKEKEARGYLLYLLSLISGMGSRLLCFDGVLFSLLSCEFLINVYVHYYYYCIPCEVDALYVFSKFLNFGFDWSIPAHTPSLILVFPTLCFTLFMKKLMCLLFYVLFKLFCFLVLEYLNTTDADKAFNY